MKFFFRPLSIGMLLCLFVGCKTENDTLPIAAGKEYYPLQIGKAWVYNVDTVTYDPDGGVGGRLKVDTAYWTIREVMTDTFRDASGILNYKIERYERPRDSAKFQIARVFSAAVNDVATLRTENNLKFLKVPLQVLDKQTFDGNVYIDESLIIIVAGERVGLFSKKWNYDVQSIGKPEKIGTKDYADVLTIRAQSDPRILTEKRYNIEKYARGIGLVYREQHILDTQKLDATVAWEKKAEKGYIVKMTAVGFQ